jgi:hypothetical protein
LNSAQNNRIVVAVPVASYASATGTNANVIDTYQFRYLTVTVQLGAMGGSTTFTAFKLEGSETADFSAGVADITGCVASGSTGTNRLPQAADAQLIARFYVPINGSTPRYIRFAGTPGAATIFGATAQLSDGVEVPSTRAERNNTLEFLRS